MGNGCDMGMMGGVTKRLGILVCDCNRDRYMDGTDYIPASLGVLICHWIYST
jgi:hypothetical protein